MRVAAYTATHTCPHNFSHARRRFCLREPLPTRRLAALRRDVGRSLPEWVQAFQLLDR